MFLLAMHTPQTKACKVWDLNLEISCCEARALNTVPPKRANSTIKMLTALQLNINLWVTVMNV